MNKIVTEFHQWFIDLDFQWISGRILATFLVVFLSLLLIKVGNLLIGRIFAPKGARLMDEKRLETLKILLKSILRYAVYFVAIMIILELFKVPTGSFLAGAGILGLAVGFGAQNLVKDIITGFFIIFEDQFSVGEYITTSGASGIVEEVGLRVTKLRDWGGELHIIPNGQIIQVTNFNRGSMRALVEIGVAYKADLDRAMAIMQEVCDQVAKEMKTIVEGPEVLGVVAFSAIEVVVRIVAKTIPNEQWTVERVLRKRIKEALDRENIEMYHPGKAILGSIDKFAPGAVRETDRREPREDADGQL